MKSFPLSLLSFLLVMLGGCSAQERVTFAEQEGRIDVLIDGKLITAYRYDGSLTKPVLYPLLTPAGVKLTRGYPFETLEGEATDHPHHVGVFFTYDEVNGSGFWNNTIFPPQIQHLETLEKCGGARGRLKTRSQWVGKDGTALLQEKRTMTFIPGEGEAVLDFDITLKALVDSVVFDDTKEGMFAVRVAHWLREDQYGQYLSSEGDIGEKGVWAKRAKWLRLAGEGEAGAVGIVIMNHPQSVNYPTFWHARGYGLFAANPLGQFVFESARHVENPCPFHLTLKQDESARFRFRMLIYDGERSTEEIEARYQEYLTE